MIISDQPTIFSSAIVAAVSSVEDGNMKFIGTNNDDVKTNRLAFLEVAGFEPLETTLLRVSYNDTTDFCRYVVIDDSNMGEGMLSPESRLVADAAVVTRPGQALFLPLADCTGAIIYDPKQEVMMMSHLGRHSVEQNGAYSSIKFLASEFGSEPEDLLIYLSPMVSADNYPLRKFDDRGLEEVILAQFFDAGVLARNLELSQSKTDTDANYYSHSQYLSGEQADDGRFALVAMMQS